MGFLEGAREQLKNYTHESLAINLEEVNEIDSIGVTALHYLKDLLSERGITVEFSGGKDHVKKKLDIFSFQKLDHVRKGKTAPLFEYIGESALGFIREYVVQFTILMANVVFWTFTDIFRPKAHRKGEFYNQAVLIGVNAVWIVAFMTFIIGLVLTLQSAAQLRNLGANIFIVDLTVIAMMREMGPLITAILVAGRSGSAIAAEVATMKVTSELDALKTMALHPVRFVVIPKMHGSIITLPFLTIIGDVMGILGGMLIAFIYLDISPQVFINRMGESLYNRDIMIGVFKSIVFAFIIVLTGSFFGLKVKEGAEGVGKVTTIAVVVAISLVIFADSIMGLLFY